MKIHDIIVEGKVIVGPWAGSSAEPSEPEKKITRVKSPTASDWMKTPLRAFRSQRLIRKYKRLANDAWKKSMQAMDRASEYEWTDPSRFPHEQTFMKYQGFNRYFSMLAGDKEIEFNSKAILYLQKKYPELKQMYDADMQQEINTLTERKRKRKRSAKSRTVYGGWWGGYYGDNSSAEGGGEGVAEGSLKEFAPGAFGGGGEEREFPRWLSLLDVWLQQKGFKKLELVPGIGYKTQWQSTRDSREHIDVIFAPFEKKSGEPESGVIKIQVTLIKNNQVVKNRPVIKKISPTDKYMKLVKLILSFAIQSRLDSNKQDVEERSLQEFAGDEKDFGRDSEPDDAWIQRKARLILDYVKKQPGMDLIKDIKIGYSFRTNTFQITGKNKNFNQTYEWRYVYHPGDKEKGIKPRWVPHDSMVTDRPYPPDQFTQVVFDEEIREQDVTKDTLEEINRRGFLRGIGAAAVMSAGQGMAQTIPDWQKKANIALQKGPAQKWPGYDEDDNKWPAAKNAPPGSLVAYRGDTRTGKLETLPILIRKEIVSQFLNAYKLCRDNKLLPSISPETWAALLLVEGRSDFGYNGPDILKKYSVTPEKQSNVTNVNYTANQNNASDKFGPKMNVSINMNPIRQGLKKLGISENDWRADFCELLSLKIDTAKRLQIPFYQAWNGGTQFLNRYRLQLQAIQDPKNKPLMNFIRGILGDGAATMEASSAAQQAAIAINKKKRSKLKEDWSFAGLKTGGLFQQNPKIWDDTIDSYLNPDDFFTKYPQHNKEQWQKEVNQFFEKINRQKEIEKSKTATDISGNATTPELAKIEQQDLLKILTPDEQNLYKQLYKTDRFKAGRLLKQAWRRKVQQDQMKRLVKVHYTKSNDLQKFLTKQISNKIELSVVMYKSVDEIPSKASWDTGYDEYVGIILDGWVTLAGGMDLSTDNQRIGKHQAGVRSDQKYSFLPSRIETDVNKMRTTKAELGSGWNEALIDNWKITGIVIPDGVSQTTVDSIKKYNLPIVDLRTK